MNKSTGNMYSFITHTWNPIKGKCPYDCSYCYMKKWGEQKPLHLDEKELNKNLGEGNYIFICSGCDIFNPKIPMHWKAEVFKKMAEYPKNKYLLHTKNPNPINGTHFYSKKNVILCTTIESNIIYDEMGKAPTPINRFCALDLFDGKKMITIEPIMDFDLGIFATLLIQSNAFQINIGADSKGSKLPEPPKGKILGLIQELKPHAKIYLKKNLKRICPDIQEGFLKC